MVRREWTFGWCLQVDPGSSGNALQQRRQFVRRSAATWPLEAGSRPRQQHVEQEGKSFRRLVLRMNPDRSLEAAHIKCQVGEGVGDNGVGESADCGEEDTDQYGGVREFIIRSEKRISKLDVEWLDEAVRVSRLEVEQAAVPRVVPEPVPQRERERDRTLTTPSPGHIKDHELKAIRLSAHKNIKIERKTAQERPRTEGLTGQKSPPWQSPSRRQSHTIPPGRPRCQWRSRSKGKSAFSRMGANVPDGSRRGQARMTDRVLSTCQGSKTHFPEAHHEPSEGATPVSTHHCARRSENAGQ